MKIRRLSWPNFNDLYYFGIDILDERPVCPASCGSGIKKSFVANSEISSINFPEKGGSNEIY
jgi:hypothetical protein